MDPIPVALKPSTKEPDVAALYPESTITDRVRAVWAVVRVFAEEAVGWADVMHSTKTGAEKKALVVDRVMGLLKGLEGKLDLLPGLLEPIVFFAIERGLDFVIDKVVAELRERSLPGKA